MVERYVDICMIMMFYRYVDLCMLILVWCFDGVQRLC